MNSVLIKEHYFDQIFLACLIEIKVIKIFLRNFLNMKVPDRFVLYHSHQGRRCGL